MKKDFNEFRFKGLNYKEISNKYYTMNRLNEDETKIVVKVGDSHLQETKYGYALILDCNHVVFLKSWQVSRNYFGNEVILTEEYFNVKEWGDWLDFGEDSDNLKFSTWVNAAKAQSKTDVDGLPLNRVRWAK